jgi:Domain of unknown function (DUF4389)
LSHIAHGGALRGRAFYHGNSATGELVIVIPEGTSAPQQLFVYEHDAGRLELLVRILYWILIGIVMWVYGLIAGICLFIQWFHILILGCRNEALSNIAKGYLEYMVHVLPYTYFMTDKRPDVMPVAVKIYEEV